MLIADGVWRESALSYDRSFFLFDDATLEAGAARLEAACAAGKGSSAATGPARAASG